MTFTQATGSFKRALLALAVAAALPAAHAASSVSSGTSTLTFSDTAIDTLALISVTVGASGSTGVVNPGRTFSLPVAGGTFDASDAFATLGTVSDAGVTLNKTGMSITLADFHVDVASKTLYGDITIGGSTTDNAAIYTFTNLVENKIDATHRTINGSGMFLTASAVKTLGDALGVPPFLQGVVGTVDFGTLNTDVVLTTTAVPEPETFALMGLGLGVLAFMQRRRARNAAAGSAITLAA